MSARKSIAWSLGANFTFFVVQFGASVVLARLLTPAEMGVYAISVSTMWLLNTFQTLGLPGYIVRERDMDRIRLGTVCTIAGLQALLLASLLWFGAPLIALILHEPRMTPALRVMCLFALLFPVQTTLSAVLQRQMRFDLSSMISLVNVIVAAAVTVACAFSGLSYMSMPWGAAAGAAIGAGVAIAILRRELPLPVTLVLWRDVWAYGSKILMTASVQNICGRLPDLILGRLAGVAATGLYNRGSGLIDTFNNALIGSFQRVGGSLFRQHRDEVGTIRYAYIRMLRIMTGLFWPAFAGLAILAAPTITFLFGAKWLTATPVLRLLCLAAIINHSLPCRAEAMVTMGQVARLPRIEVIRGLTGVSVFAVGASFGLAWAAATRIGDALLSVLLFTPWLRTVFGVGAKDLRHAYMKSAIAAAAAAAPAGAWMALHGWPDSLPPSELFGAIVVGISCWLVAIFAVRHELWVEIERAARNFFAIQGLRR